MFGLILHLHKLITIKKETLKTKASVKYLDKIFIVITYNYRYNSRKLKFNKMLSNEIIHIQSNIFT